MDKSARKRAKDPVQEALRSHKDEWNKDTSKLIQHLISLKRGLNGAGDPSSGIPASRITEPLPSGVDQLASEVQSEFQAMLSHLDQISQEQDSYSASKTAGLISEGSWAWSRFKAKFPWFGSLSKVSPKVRQKQKSMLNYCVLLEDSLRDAEHYISQGSDPGKILHHSYSVLGQFDSIISSGGYQGYLSLMLEDVSSKIKELEKVLGEKKPEGKNTEKPKPEESKSVKPAQEEVASLDWKQVKTLDKKFSQYGDELAAARQLQAETGKEELTPMISELESAIDAWKRMVRNAEKGAKFSPEEQDSAVRRIESAREGLKSTLELVTSQPTATASISQLFNLTKKSDAFSYVEVYKIAHNPVQRYLNRKLLELSNSLPFLNSEEKQYRIDAITSILQLKIDTDKLMDELEKPLDFSSALHILHPIMERVYGDISNLGELVFKYSVLKLNEKETKAPDKQWSMRRTPISQLQARRSEVKSKFTRCQQYVDTIASQYSKLEELEQKLLQQEHVTIESDV